MSKFPFPKVCKQCNKIYAGYKKTVRCLPCEKDHEEDTIISRIASAETILELLQPDSNPEFFYIKAQEHLKKYRG